MTMTRGATLALALALAAPLAPAQSQPPTEAQRRGCRQAADQAVEQLKRIPPANAREKADKEALQARIEKLIAQNRAKGVDDCVTWSQVMGIAFNQ